MTTTNKVRWWPLIAILIVAAIAEIVLWNLRSGDLLKQVLATWSVVLAAVALILLWWLFFSRVPWKRRLAGLAGVAVAVGLFFTVFSFEGAAGDFSPRFAFRFAKSAEDLAVEGATARAGGGAPIAGGRLEVTAEDWPGFRGPGRDGKALGEAVRSDWEANPPRLLWRHKVGPGWSSFSVAGGLAFTQEQRGEEETVVAYRAETGEEVWTHANRVRHETFLGGTGPRATPTLYDSRLYALGATGILDCLDPLSGEPIWSRDMAEDAGTEQLDFGFAGSPLVFDDLVVVNPGKNLPSRQGRADETGSGDPEMHAGTPPGALIAYHRVTGEIVWRTGQRQAGYAAPRLETIDGERQILLYSAHGVGGHDPLTGEELWWFEWINPFGTNSIQPIVTAGGGVFISTEETGSALIEPRKSGDLRPEGGQRNTWSVTPRWERPNLFKLRFNGGVEQDGIVYGLDGGILAALDLTAGERVWKRGRYRYGQLLMLRDHLLVLAESGDVVLVDVSPEGMEEVARFHAVDGRCWNHPVVNRGLLFVRSDEEAACYDLRPGQR